MTFPQILSLVLLVLILVLSIWRHVNIGLLGFCAAAVMVTATQFYTVTGSATAPDPALLLTSKSVFRAFSGFNCYFTHWCIAAFWAFRTQRKSELANG